MIPRDFVAVMREALAIFPALPEVAKEIIVAHGALESGWGEARAAREGFNLFNLTAGKKWLADGAPVVVAPDRAPDGHGGWRPITQRFRKYQSWLDGIEDYLRFIGPETRYERAWNALLAGNAAQFVIELRAAGYFTAPLDEYQRGLLGALATVRRQLAPRVIA